MPYRKRNLRKRLWRERKRYAWYAVAVVFTALTALLMTSNGFWSVALPSALSEYASQRFHIKNPSFITDVGPAGIGIEMRYKSIGKDGRAEEGTVSGRALDPKDQADFRGEASSPRSQKALTIQDGELLIQR